MRIILLLVAFSLIALTLADNATQPIHTPSRDRNSEFHNRIPSRFDRNRTAPAIPQEQLDEMNARNQALMKELQEKRGNMTVPGFPGSFSHLNTQRSENRPNITAQQLTRPANANARKNSTNPSFPGHFRPRDGGRNLDFEVSKIPQMQTESVLKELIENISEVDEIDHKTGEAKRKGGN